MVVSSIKSHGLVDNANGSTSEKRGQPAPSLQPAHNVPRGRTLSHGAGVQLGVHITANVGRCAHRASTVRTVVSCACSHLYVIHCPIDSKPSCILWLLVKGTGSPETSQSLDTRQRHHHLAHVSTTEQRGRTSSSERKRQQDGSAGFSNAVDSAANNAPSS